MEEEERARAREREGGAEGANAVFVRLSKSYLLYGHADGRVPNKCIQHIKAINAAIDRKGHALPTTHERVDLGDASFIERRLKARQLLLPFIFTKVRPKNDHNLVARLTQWQTLTTLFPLFSRHDITIFVDCRRRSSAHKRTQVWEDARRLRVVVVIITTKFKDRQKLCE